MTSVRPTATHALPVRQPAAAAPPAPESTHGGDGIIVNDHPIARNFLRWGGAAAGVAGLGVLASRFVAPGSSLAAAGSRYAPLAIGAAALGAAMVGSSFLGGLQPDRLPFLQSNLPTLDAAKQAARAHGEDVAIYQRDGGNYALVDFAPRDFDNEDLNDLDLGNRDIDWTALVTRDGDLLQKVDDNGYQNVGRAYPSAVRASDLRSREDVARLAGTQIGTTDGHQAVSLGQPVGAPEGYGNWADAAKAAFEATGQTAIVQAAGRSWLFSVSGPANTPIYTVEARGTGLTPVSVINVQEGKKIFRSGAPGYDMGFVGRAVPFDPNEPLGSRVGRHRLDSLVRTHPGAREAVTAIRQDIALVDAVFLGREAGRQVIASTNPDGSKLAATYRLGNGSGPVWDEQLGATAGLLQREHHSWREESVSNWNDEHRATAYYQDFNRTDAVLRDTPDGDHVLRTTGDIRMGGGIDWYATNARRAYLEDLYDEPATSPGDDPATSPGDDDEPVTSPGDDPATSPGDDGPGTSDPDDSGPGNPDFE